MKQEWRWWWKFWVVIGILTELCSLRIGTPLTQVARKYMLKTPWGSRIAGAFLVWLPYHWLLVVEGLGWGDVGALVTGAVVGELGWRARQLAEEDSH